MRIENCVPMIALCLLLCGCGKQTAEPAADLRSVYQEMSGCEMTAEVTCEQSGLEWSATLHGTYVPGGESTVEVLEPLELAGVRAVIREEGWTLEYGDLCLDAGTLTEEAVSPATALARIVYALREGWLLGYFLSEGLLEGWRYGIAVAAAVLAFLPSVAYDRYARRKKLLTYTILRVF